MQPKWYKKASVQSALIGGICLIIAAIIAGIFNLFNPSKKKEQDISTITNVPISQPIFRSKPILNLSEQDVRDMIRKYNFYNKGHNKSIWRNLGGQDFKNKYILHHNDKVVIDYSSGLMWQREGSGIHTPIIFNKASSYIKQLNESYFAGYNDWRLPTIEESMTLVERDTNSYGLYIHNLFDWEQISIWTCDMLDSTQAWHVLFNCAGCDHFELDFAACVRAVR